MDVFGCQALGPRCRINDRLHSDAGQQNLLVAAVFALP
jgi:hypothetical protein